MAESSFPWTDGTGDGGPYTADAFDTFFEHLFLGTNAASEGVIAGDGGELKVSGTSSPVVVAAGAAVVKGKIYVNTASVDVSIPTPSSATRVDLIALRASWSAQTVRIVRIPGTEGGGAPPLTQVDGVTWEIPLAQVSVTTSGIVTVTDMRTMRRAHAEAEPMLGTIARIYTTLGGSDGHRPVNPKTGLADERWHWCNGETVNGIPLPDTRDRLAMAAGSTYAHGTAGGAATVNLAHTHGVGTLAAASESSHTHGVGTIAAASESSHTHGVGTIAAANESSHTHGVGTLADNPAQAGLHNHTVSSDTPTHYHQLISVSSEPGLIISVPGNYRTYTDYNTGGVHSHGGLTGSTNPNAHTHGLAGNTGAGSAHTHVMSGNTAAGSAHTHTLTGTSAAGSAHTHALSGSTASAGSSSQSVLNPYFAIYEFCYVGYS